MLEKGAMFQTLRKIPQDLLTCQPTDVLDVLGKPTLFHFSGQKKPALFVAGFIHGNETTGFYVLQELIKRYGETNWPRETYFFVGNVWAAREGKRRLDHQPDFNRIWRQGELAENKMAIDVMRAANPKELFACIDIHNNTGRNPRYAIVESLGVTHLNLAALFGDQCLYFSEPDYTCSESFGHTCPAVTIETGLSGSVEGIAHALEFVNTVMRLDVLPSKPLAELDLKVLNSLGTIKIDPQTIVGIGQEDGDILLAKDFDLMNFKLQPAGTLFARYKNNHRLGFFDSHGNDVTETFFEHRDGRVLSRVAMVPTMLKLDKHVIKTNCVGYAMRQVDLVDKS